MKLVRFSTQGQSPRLGVLQGERVADLQASVAATLARRGVVRAQEIAATFAARPDASVGILDEACGHKAKWIVHGDDLRPRPSATKAFEWETHRFQWER